MTINWLNCVAGFGVGALVGLTGVGGGSLTVPIMILIFGIAPSTAVGTDLWFAGTTKIFGAWIHGTKGTIDKQILVRVVCGSLPAAALTLSLAVDDRHGSRQQPAHVQDPRRHADSDGGGRNVSETHSCVRPTHGGGRGP